MEEKQDVKIVKVSYKCPKCETGYLEPSGTVFTTFPPMFPHKCNVCEYGETFNASYPRIEYEPIKEQLPLTEDEILQRICDAMNYNNMCARATLGDLPKITIDDLKQK